jgi:hypothetical protein
MLTYLILGMTYPFAAAVPPGSFQTYAICEAISHGWRHTLPAALAGKRSKVTRAGRGRGRLRPPAGVIRLTYRTLANSAAKALFGTSAPGLGFLL